uniref:FIG022979: MoxR-like ATPases n=1 Tax=uncultured Thiotrichaceae bacterium TaxID=298394 RepID=A0A6S6TDE0_9GAMM|nr:MAG: FIG022979: MoxR-like ATPases [uncultured Thiotrichaceae bacterium]
MTAATPQLINAALTALNTVILGKEHQIKLALCSLLANGHLLLEDLPGMGKTTLAHALARVCGLDYNRVQFTSDLLPADLTGVSIFDRDKSTFNFHKGPLFTQVFLADELNRASPKAQSALLEAMEEQQVSIDGKAHPLPSPFFVIATQNPQSQSGTFPLPESQLDRFLLRISLGYPDPAAERQLLKGASGRAMSDKLPQILSEGRLRALQSLVPQVKMTDTLLDYIQRLIAHTRQSEHCQIGLSPRGAQALVRCAQSWALLQTRSHVLPEDIQAVFIAVAGHRLVGQQALHDEPLARRILSEVDVVG